MKNAPTGTEWCAWFKQNPCLRVKEREDATSRRDAMLIFDYEALSFWKGWADDGFIAANDAVLREEREDRLWSWVPV